MARKKSGATEKANNEPPTKNPVGRPSSFTPEIADAICEWIAGGGSLSKFIALDGNPSLSMVQRWLEEHEDFRVNYARARDLQADHYVDIIGEIALDEPDVNRARVRVDAAKWQASKLAPARYGDRLDLNVTERPQSREELEGRARQLFERARQLGDKSAGLKLVGSK